MSLPQIDPTVHLLTGELHDTLEAIISGCAFVASAPAPSELPDPESDEAEQGTEFNPLNDVYGGVTLTVRVLARSLIARTLGQQPPAPVEQYYVPGESHPETDTDTAVLDTLARALLPPDVPGAPRPSRADQKAAFEDAAFLLREVGLEEFDVSCDLESVGDGTYELLTREVSPEAAHLELLEFLFDRAEGVALDEDALLAIERNASSWEFLRWNAAPPPGRGGHDIATFARHMREQEYSLADRETVALGVPVLADLADEMFAELFPRQHRMAMALMDSVVGVFECVAIDGNRATMRSIHDGSTYVVHEHMDEISYSTGWVGAGRLLPFDGGVHLRSLGMVFARAKDLDLMFGAQNDIGALDGVLPPALAVEAFISATMLGVRIPRDLKPMRSKADAREVLSALQQLLADAALKPDATLEAFVVALAEQASAGSPVRAKAKAKGRRRRH